MDEGCFHKDWDIQEARNPKTQNQYSEYGKAASVSLLNFWSLRYWLQYCHFATIEGPWAGSPQSGYQAEQPGRAIKKNWKERGSRKFGGTSQKNQVKTLKPTLRMSLSTKAYPRIWWFWHFFWEYNITAMSLWFSQPTRIP